MFVIDNFRLLKMIKIKEIKIQNYGRGLMTTLPEVFASDNKISAGDFVKVYREKKHGIDVLIFAKNELPDDSILIQPPIIGQSNER